MKARDILRAALHSLVEFSNEGEFLRIGAGGTRADGRREYGAGIVLNYNWDTLWPDHPSLVYKLSRAKLACWWPS